MAHLRGTAIHNSLFSENEVREIRTRFANRAAVPCSQYELALEFDCSRQSIWYIVHRHTWGWIDDGIPPPPRRAPRVTVPRTDFWTEEEVATLLTHFHSGLTYAMIAFHMRRSRSAIAGQLARRGLKRKGRGSSLSLPCGRTVVVDP